MHIQKIQFDLELGYFMDLLGCVLERKGQGLFKYALKECYKYQRCVNEPESYLQIQYYLIFPNLVCFYLVIRVESICMNDAFGLPGAFVT